MNPEEREPFLGRLREARGADRLRLLTEARQIHEAWLLPTLASLLDDEELILERVHVTEVVPEVGECKVLVRQRTCDLALELIQRIAGRDFGIRQAVPIPHREYTAEERAGVRRALGEP